MERLLVCFLFFCSAIFLAQGQDACENSFNIDYWKNKGGFFEFRAQLETCGFKLFTMDEAVRDEEGRKCLKNEEGMPYNDECVDCFVGLSLCAIEFCAGACLVDAEGAACESCNELNCNGPYYACAGNSLDPSGCSDCVNPTDEEQIIPGVENFVFYSVVGVFSALLVLALGAVYLNKQDESWDEYHDDFDWDEEYENNLKHYASDGRVLGGGRKLSIDEFGHDAVFDENFTPFKRLKAGQDVPLDEI